MVRGIGKIKYLTIMLLIFVPIILIADDSYTISDVLNVQQQASGDVQTISASVDSVTTYGDKSQPVSYDYILQTDSNGNNKMMITSKGVFTMQFLVDTSDMSVTYLMADGSLKKVTTTAEEKAQIQQMASIGGVSGFGNKGSMYAALGIKKGTLSDGTYKNKFETNKFETDDMVINVKGRKGSGKKFLGLVNEDDITDVEYLDKKVQNSALQIDDAVNKIKTTKPKNKQGEEVKEQAIKWFEMNRNKARKGMIAKRIEHINMRTGMVEEQEMYNPDGEKVGHMKVKSKRKYQVSSQNLKTQATASSNSSKEIEIPDESEVEMGSGAELSKTNTIISNVAINQPAAFTWIKVKK